MKLKLSKILEAWEDHPGSEWPTNHPRRKRTWDQNFSLDAVKDQKIKDALGALREKQDFFKKLQAFVQKNPTHPHSAQYQEAMKDMPKEIAKLQAVVDQLVHHEEEY